MPKESQKERIGKSKSAKRPFDSTAKTARKTPYSKSDYKKSAQTRKNSGVSKQNARQTTGRKNSVQSEKKTGLFSRIKAFFTKK